MSLVADIIASVKHKNVEKDCTMVQMEDLMKQSEEAKVNVCQALTTRYDYLSTSLHDTLSLQSKLKACLSAISNIELKIQDDVLGNVESSIGEVSRVSHRWKEVTVELEASQRLLDIHTLLEESLESQLNHKFYISAEKLNQVDELLDKASEKDIDSQLDIIATLKEELILKRNELVFKVGEAWVNLISWDQEECNDRSHSYCLTIHHLESNEMNQEEMHQMFMALLSLGELQRRISTFGKIFLKRLIRPVISEFAEVKILQPSVDAFSIQVIKPIKPPKNHQINNSAVEILQNIEEIFEFVHKVLFFTSVNPDEKAQTLMTLLGQEIAEEFTKIILKDCLADSVPCNRKDLDSFERVKLKAEEFNKFLVSIGFFNDNQKSLMDYAANVETVFSNKVCANLLSKARDLMVKPLHVTATISPMRPGEPLQVLDEAGNHLEKTSFQLGKLLSAQTFNLPKCQVSVSACNLVDLIYDTLEECCSSSPEYAGRLFYTVRNILSLYCHIVPTAHAQTLCIIPQHAALVHNNSMFIAHHALLIGHQYRNRFPAALRDSSLTTADLGQLIRTTGCEVFLKAMQSHRSDLLATLREGLSLSSLGCEQSAVNSAELSVKQCLHQLERLHTVWQSVLPHSVYVKSMGALVGSIVEDIVVRIVGLQDISADAALGLINVLSLLQDNVPSLFKVDGEADTSDGDALREVALWSKMKELTVVLGANLRELMDRWSDGKGPFALHFNPDEAKQLIRALFQNTERRAQVLAKIK